MRKRIEKIFTVIFAVCMFISCNTFSVNSAQEQNVKFVDIYNSSLTFYVSDNGVATLTYTVSGRADSGKIIIKSYIDRKTLGVFWSRIKLSDGSSEWTDTSTGVYTSNTHTLSVSKDGTYRATIVIYVDGESITKTAEFEYSRKNIMGDVNFDGRITASDARSTLRYSARLDSFTDSQKYRADMDGNGVVTASDARRILRQSAGFDSNVVESTTNLIDWGTTEPCTPAPEEDYTNL